MATIAVVIAVVGGGIAIGGQKDTAGEPAVIHQASVATQGGIPGGDKERMLKVPGLGTFTASQAQSAPSGGITYKNTTDRTFRITRTAGIVNGSDEFAYQDDSEVAPGEEQGFGSTATSLFYNLTFVDVNAGKSTPIFQAVLNTATSDHWISVIAPKG